MENYFINPEKNIGKLFRRGYLITDQDIADSSNIYIKETILKNWKKDSIKNLNLYLEPHLEFAKTEDNSLAVCIMGLVIDPINQIMDIQKICKNIFSNYQQSEAAFFEYLDLLSGNFIVLLAAEQRSFVL
jgi:hypothetical protein